MMFYLKIAMIYAILFASIALLTVSTSLKNPAITFFVPSIIAMMMYARMTFSNPKASVGKHAIACGLAFGVISTLLVWVVDLKYGWITRPQIMYIICFAGNFFFPLMIFPKAKRAQDG